MSTALDKYEINADGWSLAIREARRKIHEAEELIPKLRESIRIFEDKRKKDEPWPGEDQVA